jgi:hypothetical protein
VKVATNEGKPREGSYRWSRDAGPALSTQKVGKEPNCGRTKTHG